MLWTESLGRIELQLTKAQAARGAHPGQCDEDIAALRQLPAIRRQLAKLKPETVAACMREYGAWNADELANHDDNLNRLLWVACCDIVDGIN